MLRGGPRGWQQLPPPELLFWSLGVGWGELLPKRNHCPLWEIQQEPPLSLPEQGRDAGVAWAGALLTVSWSRLGPRHLYPPLVPSASVTCPTIWEWGEQTHPACDGEGLVPITLLSNLSLWGRLLLQPQGPAPVPPGSQGPQPSLPAFSQEVPSQEVPGLPELWLPPSDHVFVAEQVAFPEHVRGTWQGARLYSLIRSSL